MQKLDIVQHKPLWYSPDALYHMPGNEENQSGGDTGSGGSTTNPAVDKPGGDRPDEGDSSQG